jgi:hypothetical protein
MALLILAAAVPTVALDAGPVRTKPKLVILDIELTGDLGGPQFAAEHEARLRLETETLRQQLQQSGLYTVIDAAPARPLIAKLKSQQSYLHDCNGCDLEIGKQLGADQVLVTWVDRVSGLILSLTYEFHDVATSQIVGRKSYDFRGDNDSSWTHAIKYMVRDLEESAAAHPERIASRSFEDALPGIKKHDQTSLALSAPVTSYSAPSSGHSYCETISRAGGINNASCHFS